MKKQLLNSPEGCVRALLLARGEQVIKPDLAKGMVSSTENGI